MPGMWWVVGAVVAVALLSAYLFWTAHRVERVHVRAQSAERALDAHLMRRAAAAAVVAEQRDDDELYSAARAALDAAPDERESAENDLTRQLQAVTLDAADAAARTLVATSRRVVLARQVHTDLVRDALTSRRRVVVRVSGMARRYPLPQYFDIVEPMLGPIASAEPLMAPAVVPAEAV
jgi:predicted negative regulator of RcsB-dependent stress response